MARLGYTGRRRVLAGGLLAPFAAQAQAQGFPNGPVRLVVPSAPGGNPDLMARLVAEPLAAALGVPVVIENRPGVASNLGTEYVIRSRPDGQTLLLGSVNNAINDSFYRNIGFDWLAELAPVGALYLIPNVVLVNRMVPATTLPELVALAKARPGELNFGSSGNGTTPHLSGELLKQLAGIDMVHVPYRASADAHRDLEAGRLQIYIDNLPPSLARIEAGRVRPLAITSAERSPLLPTVPTVAEAGYPDLRMLIFGGLFAPSRTPEPVLARLGAEVAKVTGSPAFQARLRQLGSAQIEQDRAAFRAFTVAETARWADVVRKSGAEAQ